MTGHLLPESECLDTPTVTVAVTCTSQAADRLALPSRVMMSTYACYGACIESSIMGLSLSRVIEFLIMVINRVGWQTVSQLQAGAWCAPEVRHSPAATQRTGCVLASTPPVAVAHIHSFRKGVEVHPQPP